MINGEPTASASDADYRLIKSVEELPDNPDGTIENSRNLSYIIKAIASDSNAAYAAEAAGEADLAGKWTTDVILAGLDLKDVWLAGPESQWEPQWVPLEGYIYDENARILKYHIPSGQGSIKETAIKIDTALDNKTYNGYLISGGSYTHAFPNKAVLQGTEDGDRVATSNRVNPKIHLVEGLTKASSGVPDPIDLSDRTMQWLLDVTPADHIYNIGFFRGAVRGHVREAQVRAYGYGGAYASAVSGDHLSRVQPCGSRNGIPAEAPGGRCQFWRRRPGIRWCSRPAIPLPEPSGSTRSPTCLFLTNRNGMDSTLRAPRPSWSGWAEPWAAG